MSTQAPSFQSGGRSYSGGAIVAVTPAADTPFDKPHRSTLLENHSHFDCSITHLPDLELSNFW